MKTNRVRQATDTETTGLIGRAMKAITDSPNTAAAYGLWTTGTLAAVVFALRGQSKREKFSGVISHGAISALGCHLTATGVSVRDAVSDNSAQILAQNVVKKLNVFLNETAPCTIKVESTGGDNFSMSLGFITQSFTLTSGEMNKIVNATNNMDIYDVIKTPLKNKNITSIFDDNDNKLTLIYINRNVCDL